MMQAPDMEKPRITEIKVRMDCNGCVQKIKKALHGINGIYDVYIDFPQQKVTVIGWADVEKLVRAIKKTRKTAVICSHIEQPTPDQQPTTDPPPPEGGNPPPENNNAEPPPHTEEAQNEPPRQENPQPPESGNDTNDQLSPQAKPRDAEEIHIIHHHPPDYGYRYAYGHGHHNPQQGHGGQFEAHERVRNVPQVHSSHFGVYPGGGSEFRGDSSYRFPPAQTGYVTTHSYNTHRPSPYVTEYAYPRPSSPPRYPYYSRPDHHHYINQDYYYYYSGNNVPSGNGNITSMFSDENPNSCTIA